MKNNNLIRRYLIIGERRLSNYWWATVVLLGALGFLFTGFLSYLNTNIDYNLQVGGLDNTSVLETLGNTLSVTPVNTNSISLPSVPTIATDVPSTRISFFPQGLLMCFYGSLGFLLSLYWWFLIFWNVGGGFNEFNKKEGFIRIFRWGYPGQNRKIDLYYTLKDVESIRVELKQGGFADSQRTIFLKFKGKKEIPLTGIGEPLTLQEIEKQASELANFLQVSLEGL
uniref:Photosystem I assembly protein Ycf4 n=1 Tax=Kirchneriella aperta TaxID=117505 RepID=A0A140HA14_9CHLO|nr:hypothetical chloroplast protein RF4 [Kirchneriella aperta]AMO01013.1 hypothetical chloroplast protein RF4 [Kirchneriella aperta]